jgi:hypothetical protein
MSSFEYVGPNPYKDTFVVSSGSRTHGKTTFSSGTVLSTKNHLMRIGLNVINDRRTAKYVVIPDGAHPGKIDAAPINYSDILFILQNYKDVGGRDLHSENTEPSTFSTMQVSPEIDVKKIEMEIDSQERIDAYSSQRIGGTEDEERNIQKTPEIYKYSPPIRTERRFAILSSSSPLVQKYLGQLTSPLLGEFIDNVVQETMSHYVSDIYTSYWKTLEVMDKNFVGILKYMADVRSNILIVSELNPLPDFSSVQETCSVDKDIPGLEGMAHGKKWVLDVWSRFRKFYRSGIPLEFQDPEAFSQLSPDKQRQITGYFQVLEIYVNLMRISVLCAQKSLTKMYIEWEQNFRKSYEEGCGTYQGSSCETNCFWTGKTCEEKPFLSVVEDVLKVYCNDRSTDTESKRRVVDMVDKDLMRIFQGWFGSFPDNVKHTNVCNRVAFLYGSIRRNVEDSLGGDHKQLVWSKIPEILDIPKDEWNLFWRGGLQDKDQFLKVLETAKKDSKLTRLFLELTRVVATLK